MADGDVQLAPWLQKDKAPSTGPEGVSVPDAPWLSPKAAKPEVSTGEDIAKVAGPAAIRGTIGALTMPGTLLDLVEKGVDYGFHKVAPETAAKLDKRREELASPSESPGGITGALESARKVTSAPQALLPAAGNVTKKVEENVTGPLYQAQTPGGRAFQTGVEVLPSLAAGGEGLIPTALRAIGAGVGGEAAREGGEMLKPHLPQSIQPAVEPVSQAIGTMIGGGLAPRAVTPYPMDAQRAATVAALRRQAPGINLTAGQQANNPALLSLEARAPSMANVPAQQAQQFTDAAMQQMGSRGGYNPANLAEGEAVGREIGAIRSSNQIDSTNFTNLVNTVNQQRLQLQRVVGRNNTPAIDELRRDLLAGAAQIPGQRVFSMPGARYGYLRDNYQQLIDKAASPNEKTALSQIRSALDQAFHNSLPTDTSARLHQLENQYTNYSILRNMPPNAEHIASETVSPMDVLRGAASHMGNSAVNANRGTLVPLARNAQQTMVPHPEVRDSGGSALNKLIGGAIGGLGTAGITHAAGHGNAFDVGLLGSIVGHENLGPAVDVLKNAAARVAASRPGQAYLKNQVAAPRREDPSALIRLLLSPAETQLLPRQ